MPPALSRVLLVGVITEVAAALHTALGQEVDLIQVTSDEVLAHITGRPDDRRPTLVVVGREVQAAVGLVHALRPDGVDLAVIVVSTPVTQADLATLPLLFSADKARQVPAAQVDQLPATARQLLEVMTRQSHYNAVRAAAQRQLAGGAAISRQLASSCSASS